MMTKIEYVKTIPNYVEKIKTIRIENDCGLNEAIDILYNQYRNTLDELDDKKLVFLHGMKKAFIQKLKVELEQIEKEIEKRADIKNVDSIEFYTKNIGANGDTMINADEAVQRMIDIANQRPTVDTFIGNNKKVFGGE